MKKRAIALWFCCGVVLSLVLRPGLAEDWPQFRGPVGDGVSFETRAPLTWTREQNVRWRRELPEPGNSSPIVSRGRVFLSAGADKGTRRMLHCFDRATGELVWSKTVSYDKVMPTHETNPPGSSTPAADGSKVVVWHGSAGLSCYDFNGKEIWHRDLGEFRHMWGYGSSPVLHGNRVYLQAGPGKRVFVAAFDLESGRTIWETPEPVSGDGEHNEQKQYMGSWTTPRIIRQGGAELLLCTMATRVNAYDLKTGKIVWTCPGVKGRKGDLAYSSPLVDGEHCYVFSGFNGPSFAFRMTGSGELGADSILWRHEPNPQNIGSGVFLNGSIYVVDAGPNTIRCIDPETGRARWEERGEAAYWGSITAVAGRLYVTNQKGDTVVFEPNPGKFVQLAMNRLGETCNATPAISEGEIFLRTHQALYCISGKIAAP